MRRMKISFIEPQPPYNAYSYSELPLLGSLYLGTVLSREGHQVRIYNEKRQKLYDERSGRIHPSLLDSNVVAISIVTCTADRGYKIATAIKKTKPAIRVMIGGPHASSLPEEAANYADLVVKGEAESVISDLVNDGAKEGIVEGRIIDNLDSLPFPDLSLIEGLKLPMRFAPISTSRGCPYACSFCYVSSLFGKEYRFRSADSVLEEISQRYKENQKGFFFYDDNFAANKNRTKTLLEKILQKNMKLRWVAEARTDVARDSDLLRLMARANCLSLLIGFESVNPATLNAYNKKQRVEDIEDCIMKLHHHEIKVHGMFVLGSDEDDVYTIKRTIRFCHKWKIDTAQFAILVPLPGTELYSTLNSQKRIFTRKWSLYDGLHVVFGPKKMLPYELQMKTLWAWKKFYSLSRNLKECFISRHLIKKWERANKAFLKRLRLFPGASLPEYDESSLALSGKTV